MDPSVLTVTCLDFRRCRCRCRILCIGRCVNKVREIHLFLDRALRLKDQRLESQPFSVYLHEDSSWQKHQEKRGSLIAFV